VAQREARARQGRIGQWVVLLAAGALLTVLLLRGGILFRWGSVNGPFFVASFVVVAATALIASALTRHSAAAADAMALRGAAAFLVVPLHYATMHVIVDRLGEPPWSTGAYLIGVVPLILFAFASAKASARWLAPVSRARFAMPVLLIGMGICAAIGMASDTASEVGITLLAMALGQILAATALNVRPWRQ
jgi:hypothetical protein